MTLAAEGVRKTYGRCRVVDGVDVVVSPGEIVGLLGPNGAGKTTTFYMVVGLIGTEAGRIVLEGEEITREPMYRRARRGIGYLTQEPSIFRRMTARENLLAILETLPISRAEQLSRLAVLMGEFGITRVADTPAYLLSGGEKRRVEICRSLVTRPRYMLLDEPFLGIDPIAVSDLQQMVMGLKTRGLGILITDHNVRETLEIIDRAYIMYEGRILLQGTAKELLESPEARKVYLGERFQM